MSEDLSYRKICAWWMPQALNAEQMTTRFIASLHNLQNFHEGGNEFLDRIITGDETRIHHYYTAVKTHFINLEAQHFTAFHKSSTTTISCKTVDCVLFNKNYPLLLDFMEPGTTINSDRIQDTFTKLYTVIKHRKRGMLSRRLILLHNNTKAYTVQQIQNPVKTFCEKTIKYPSL